MRMNPDGQRLDRARIVGMSAAITLNLIVAFVLSMPGRTSLASKPPGTEQAPLLAWVESRIEPRPTSVASTHTELRPAPSRVAAPARQAMRSAAAVLPSPVVDGGEIAGPVTGGADGAGTAAGPGGDPAGSGRGAMGGGVPLPGDSRLKSIDAPEPYYPFLAERHAIEGSVYLKVFVGADGKVVSVAIVQSSGYPELDNAARRQVLRAWTFAPEIRGGKPVAASGIVLVNFKLKRV
jgi:protein TonB